MIIEPWLQQTVDNFWMAAGEREPFPRDLEHPILWALPLAIVKLPRLWVRDVKEWLARRNVPRHFDERDRPLHGCTIAYAGKGFVLLNGTDPDAERRFSLAHEVSHFLLDYLQPRQHAIDRLGEGIVDVLDGLRPPTIEERVHAILGNTPIGVQAHLLNRRADGTLGCSRIVAAEYRADRLALELLAPVADVRRHLRGGKQAVNFQAGVKHTVDVLIRDFGLPQKVADAYGRMLYTSWHSGPTVREWLGL